MKLNHSLLLEIMEYVEAQSVGIDNSISAPVFDEYCDRQHVVNYHILMAKEAGYIKADAYTKPDENFTRWNIYCLTWQGQLQLVLYRSPHFPLLGSQ